MRRSQKCSAESGPGPCTSSSRRASATTRPRRESRGRRVAGKHHRAEETFLRVEVMRDLDHRRHAATRTHASCRRMRAWSASACSAACRSVTVSLPSSAARITRSLASSRSSASASWLGPRCDCGRLGRAGADSSPSDRLVAVEPTTGSHPRPQRQRHRLRDRRRRSARRPRADLFCSPGQASGAIGHFSMPELPCASGPFEGAARRDPRSSHREPCLGRRDRPFGRSASSRPRSAAAVNGS